MLLSALSLTFYVCAVFAQRFEVNVGSGNMGGILDLMREVQQAHKAGDQERYEHLKEKLAQARSGGFDDSWESECRVNAYLDAEIFAVPGPENVPTEIQWAFQRLDAYWTKEDGSELPYPGDFDKFMHDDGFRVIMMDYDALPKAVKNWRENAVKNGPLDESKFIAVIDSVAFFAPGVVTWLQPLFATKDVVSGENACEDQLLDLNNFRGEKRQDGDVRFVSGKSGISQIGTTLRVQTYAEKQVKKVQKKTEAEDRHEL